MNDRDASIVRHMRRYCEEIDSAVTRFGDDRETFMTDPVYRNAVSMPIQQIGELAKHLSEAFVDDNPQIPWKHIRGMRNWFAHQYMSMDRDVIWEVIHEGIPPLKAFCEDCLRDIRT